MSTPANRNGLPSPLKRTKQQSKSLLPTVRKRDASKMSTTSVVRAREKSTVGPSRSTSKRDTDSGIRNTSAMRSKMSTNVAAMAFPAIISPATQRSKEMYTMNYVLDIDSQTYSTRQNDHHLGKFYKRLISNRVLQSKELTPMLAVETSFVNQTMQRKSLHMGPSMPSRTTKITGLNTVRHANLSRTIGDELNYARVDENSGLGQYATIRDEANGGDKSALLRRGDADIDKQTLLPSIAHLQSDDSLFDSKTVLADMKIQHGASQITDTRMNATELTAPQTSKQTQDQGQFYQNQTITESILQQSQLLLDPLAGNSIISQLNRSLHYEGKDKISGMIEKKKRKRSQQRRRLELGEDPDLMLKPGHYTARGNLEEVMSESSAMKTATESVADSLIYKELANDMSGFMKFLDKDSQSKEIEKAEEGDNKSKISLAESTQRQQAEEEEMRKLRLDPEAHFRNLKAKINLKVNKKYQEDVHRQKQLQQKQVELKVTLTDQYGRKMKPQSPKISADKLPSKNRLPVKKAPPKRKLSFTESQMKYYGAKDIYNPMNDIVGPSLTDKTIIDFMKQVDNFPIQEALIGRTDGQPYSLWIDSLISASYTLSAVQECAEEKPLTQAPYNSMESDEEFHVYESQESDDPNAVPYLTKKKMAQDPELMKKQFDMRLIETNGFRLESMKYYPYRSREGDIPNKLLQIPKLNHIFTTLPIIQKQQQERPFDAKLIQNIFEHYCVECKAAPIVLANYYNYDDHLNIKLSLRNLQLDEMVVKAIALVLPYIHDITEIEINNNQMTDQVASTILFAVFMNPSIRRITVAYNFMRQTFCRTLARLISMKPEKITDINLMGSILNHDHIDPVIRELIKMNNLVSLNIAGCALSQASCRQLSVFVHKGFSLRVLDVSHCRISYQGTRYLIDALNRNTCIRNFNFSHNDLNSQSYEFSIKVASMLTRHPCLMHLDITNTNLKREEVMFIGLAVPQSKTLLSIHLTAQKLPYYERIFLRAVISARVEFQKKNHAMKRDIQNNHERNQVLQMASGDVQDKAMHEYVDNLRDLDEKRRGLDFEIQDLLAEIDTEATYSNVEPEQALADLPEDSKIGALVTKLMERQKELEDQQDKLRLIYEREQQNVSQQVEALDGLQDMLQEDMAEFAPQRQKGFRKPEEELDNFQKQRELRVERHKQRAEIEVMKENQDRSAGELALMFMGINQVAQNLLVENPMTGYMNEIIFSRVLGNDEIEEGEFWMDTTQCWVCHKWNKVTLAYHKHSDKQIFQQKVTQVENLQQTIDKFVKDGLDRKQMLEQIEKVQDAQTIDSSIIDNSDEGRSRRKWRKAGNDPIADLKNQQKINKLEHKKTFKEDKNRFIKLADGTATISDGGITAILRENGQLNQGFVNGQNSNQNIKGDDQALKVEDVVDEANLGLTKNSERASSTTQSEIEKPFQTNYDTTNPIEPVKLTENLTKQVVYPSANFNGSTFISYGMPTAEQMYGSQERKLQQLEIALEDAQTKFYGEPLQKRKIRVLPPPDTTDSTVKENAQILKRHYMGSKGGGSSFNNTMQGFQQSVISHTETKRRNHREPIIIQRQIFFEGVVYMIEEELYSDPDASSVYTDSDSFEEDWDIQKRFKQNNPLLSSNKNDDFSQTANNLLRRMSTKKPYDTENNTPQTDGEVTPLSGTQKSALKKGQSKTGKGDKKKGGKSGSKTDKEKDASSKRKVSIKQDDSKRDISPIAKKKTPKDDKKKDEAPKQPKKSYSKDKQALMKEYFVNSENLTDAQKMYENKNTKKHYRPELMEKRMDWFAEHFENKAVKHDILASTSQAVTPQGTAGSDEKPHEFAPKPAEIFCVTSFNDWMPVRMKTLRRLNMERLPMDTPEDEVPKKMFALDNQVALYANMVPPGDHYFYFVKEKGTIFLSPNYEVIRFKSTNIFLNRVTVTKRHDDVETVHVAKAVEAEEPVFMKDRSVFKDYREDSQEFLLKCFLEDIQFSKINKTIKKGNAFEEEFGKIKEILFEHYVRIINIFEFYAGYSAYPTISMMKFTDFAHLTHIFDPEHMKLADLDLILVATCVSHHQFVNSQALDMQRYEFLEMIVRVANERYKDKKIVKTTKEAIEKVLTVNIYPHAQTMNGEHFRKYHCYAVKVNEILKKNENMLRRVYDSFTHAKKKFVTMPECQAYVRRVNLDISENMVGAIYAESMMTIIDPIRDQTKPNQMKFVEFFVFICRISFEHYQGGPYEKELLYLKLDHLMPALLAYLNLQPQFLFGEKFKSEEEEEMNQAVRRRQKLRRATIRAKENGEILDPKLLAEAKALDASMNKAGMTSFNASMMGNKMMDDDHISLGHSSNDEDKFQRSDDITPNVAGSGLSAAADKFADVVNDVLQNADLAADIGDDEPIGIILEAPNREGSKASPETVPEDLAGEDEEEVAGEVTPQN